MTQPHQIIANLLGVSEDILTDLDKKMTAHTGQSGVFEQLALDLARGPARREALLDRIIKLDEILNAYLGRPNLLELSKNCGLLCQTALELRRPEKGFFIKKEKAIEMLETFAPARLLEHFKSNAVRDLVEQEGFASVFGALRFVQDKDWMHTFFDKAYNDLTPDDFEERAVELKILAPGWLKVAEKFIEKKYHNVSHLKEFGVIFVIPLAIDTPGEIARIFTLLLHYLNEVPFYSSLFRKAAKTTDFASQVKSLLRGDVPESAIPESTGPVWRVVQRYLAKEDQTDFRLFEPHVNPEAEHWYKAGRDLAGLADRLGDQGEIFKAWLDLDYFGQINAGEHVSYNLIDLIMTLVTKGETKYVYHQQEALWNEIFVRYLGREKLNELIEENILTGFIKL